MPAQDSLHADPLLTTQEVAAIIGSPWESVRKWAARGYPDYPRSVRLPNGHLRTRVSNLDQWLAERER